MKTKAWSMIQASVLPKIKIRNVAYGYDHIWLLADNPAQIEVYDPLLARQLKVISYEGPIACLALDQNGLWILDQALNTILLLDIPTMQIIHHLPCCLPPGQTSLLSVADDRLWQVDGSEGVALCWSLSAKKVVEQLEIDAVITGFCQIGEHLYTLQADSPYLFEMTLHHPATKKRTWLGGNPKWLSSQEGQLALVQDHSQQLLVFSRAVIATSPTASPLLALAATAN